MRPKHFLVFLLEHFYQSFMYSLCSITHTHRTSYPILFSYVAWNNQQNLNISFSVSCTFLLYVLEVRIPLLLPSCFSNGLWRIGVHNVDGECADGTYCTLRVLSCRRPRCVSWRHATFLALYVALSARMVLGSK